VAKYRIKIGRNVLESSLRYALSSDALQRTFFAALRFGIRTSISELLKNAGVAARIVNPLPRYFRPKRALVSVEPIEVGGEVLDAEFCLAACRT
jgi:hypothetical protein